MRDQKLRAQTPGCAALARRLALPSSHGAGPASLNEPQACGRAPGGLHLPCGQTRRRTGARRRPQTQPPGPPPRCLPSRRRRARGCPPTALPARGQGCAPGRPRGPARRPPRAAARAPARPARRGAASSSSSKRGPAAEVTSARMRHDARHAPASRASMAAASSNEQTAARALITPMARSPSPRAVRSSSTSRGTAPARRIAAARPQARCWPHARSAASDLRRIGSRATAPLQAHVMGRLACWPQRRRRGWHSDRILVLVLQPRNPPSLPPRSTDEMRGYSGSLPPCVYAPACAVCMGPLPQASAVPSKQRFV
jgi:hypothetical protein